MTITQLNPTRVWKNFYSLTQIPRPSKKEGKAVLFLEKFGKDLGLETIKDSIGNIIIRKPATPGMENRQGIILQAHIDMVPQKNSDNPHNFETDPIIPRIVDQFVYATGTTLGADNGMGVAVCMSVLESKDLVHGPVEVLITIDEETGMTGARGLKGGILKGDILINLDSEDEGELYVGCAGGIDCTATFKYNAVGVPAGYVGMKLNITGMKGGHSGMDIILGRGNANKSLVRILLPLIKEANAKIASFEGGTLRNAIPRESFATIAIPKDKVQVAKKIVKKHFKAIVEELAAQESGINITLEECKTPVKVVDDATALKAVQSIYACPNGVERMSEAMENLVETSNNLAIVKAGAGKIEVKCLMRSSVDSAKETLSTAFRCLFELAGAEVKLTGGYSGWKPNMDSAILAEMKEVYKKLFGNEPKVRAIHAGLECGILGGTYPNWDMISCGPSIRSPHSPDERVEIATVEKWWKYVVEVLKAAPVKK